MTGSPRATRTESWSGRRHGEHLPATRSADRGWSVAARAPCRRAARLAERRCSSHRTSAEPEERQPNREHMIAERRIICFCWTTSSHHVTSAHHPRELWPQQSSSAANGGMSRSTAGLALMTTSYSNACSNASDRRGDGCEGVPAKAFQMRRQVRHAPNRVRPGDGSSHPRARCRPPTVATQGQRYDPGQDRKPSPCSPR